MTNHINMHTGPIHVSPKEVNYEEKAINKLDNLFISLIESGKLLSTSYLMARRGKVFAYKSMGKLRPGADSQDMLPDSLRKIYSITKIFAATAAMKLVEDGKIYLNQPISDYIDEMKNDVHKKITVQQLLTHTSGISPDSGYYCEPYGRGWWDKLEVQKLPDYPEEQKINWIKAVLSGPLSCNPGDEYCYSSSGYMLLGEFLSRVINKPVEEYILDNIITHLGMTETFFDVPEELHGRVCVTNPWELKGISEKEDKDGRPPRIAGGLYSTLMDLFRFGQMTLNNGKFNGERILGRKTIEYMTKNQLAPNTAAFHWNSNFKDFTHGLGYNLTKSDLVSPTAYNHEGYGRCALYMDPTEEFLFAYITPYLKGEFFPEACISPRSIAWGGLD